MTTVDSCVMTIDNNSLDGIEDLACVQLRMPREAVMEKFSVFFEDTLATCRDNFECKAKYTCLPIAEIESDKIVLENGAALDSKLLPEMLKGADELVLYAGTVIGYEELASKAASDPLDSMFYDAWGIAFSIATHHVVKDDIAARAHEAGRYVSRGWVPGEDNLEMKLQTKLFELLEPEEIGLALEGTFMMKPVMSITGFMGVSDDPAIEAIGVDMVDSH